MARSIDGATMILRGRASALSSFWDEVQRAPGDGDRLPGDHADAVLQTAARLNERDNPVRRAYIVPVPPRVHDSLTERYDIEIISSYGSTEANCPVHFTADCDPEKAGSPASLGARSSFGSSTTMTTRCRLATSAKS